MAIAAQWLIDRYGPARGALKRMIQKYLTDSEGGQNFSPSLREIFRRYYRVEVGKYTMGGCFVPFAFGENTTIGRYTSVAQTAFAATNNHPMQFKGMHGFFFNPALGVVTEPCEYQPLEVGNDVWLGHNSIIMPDVASIGDGAVVAAGAVVAKTVPPYAVVVGNPARVVRYRFPAEVIESLQQERWWDLELPEIKANLAEFTRDYGLDHPATAALRARTN